MASTRSDDNACWRERSFESNINYSHRHPPGLGLERKRHNPPTPPYPQNPFSPLPVGDSEPPPHELPYSVYISTRSPPHRHLSPPRRHLSRPPRPPRPPPSLRTDLRNLPRQHDFDAEWVTGNAEYEAFMNAPRRSRRASISSQVSERDHPIGRQILEQEQVGETGRHEDKRRVREQQQEEAAEAQHRRHWVEVETTTDVESETKRRAQRRGTKATDEGEDQERVNPSDMGQRHVDQGRAERCRDAKGKEVDHGTRPTTIRARAATSQQNETTQALEATVQELKSFINEVSEGLNEVGERINEVSERLGDMEKKQSRHPRRRAHPLLFPAMKIPRNHFAMATLGGRTLQRQLRQASHPITMDLWSTAMTALSEATSDKDCDHLHCHVSGSTLVTDCEDGEGEEADEMQEPEFVNVSSRHAPPMLRHRGRPGDKQPVRSKSRSGGRVLPSKGERMASAAGESCDGPEMPDNSSSDGPGLTPLTSRSSPSEYENDASERMRRREERTTIDRAQRYMKESRKLGALSPPPCSARLGVPRRSSLKEDTGGVQHDCRRRRQSRSLLPEGVADWEHAAYTWAGIDAVPYIVAMPSEAISMGMMRGYHPAQTMGFSQCSHCPGCNLYCVM
ncbi:hypothetical protein QBC33DRAFT_2326 [Phialemonium atrogriseum]|uniref:Uncharacterized protein n=1 Tax=Phialemonium atrogriseum TaxID=1093897 RepID=A0AAJ0C8N8_9PEZI|nr:uncharacterized protein QBC33DRAFT_2326 [Phialemonium atrogriseum]KAK1772208.1 hypothetical protein QBC33DRAFT_2326 [Phialemonium atrogriseum]